MKNTLDYNGYVIYRENYLTSSGRRAIEYSAYKKDTNHAEAYRIARASLKTLKREIDNG